jgi:hypothetical protein
MHVCRASRAEWPRCGRDPLPARRAASRIVESGRPWSFDGDGALFRLVAEAHRIRLAHLFDPVLAVHTSLVEPLPHQITAVYEAMLPRQPLRFLLADDPGAGKTIIVPTLITPSSPALFLSGQVNHGGSVLRENYPPKWVSFGWTSTPQCSRASNIAAQNESEEEDASTSARGKRLGGATRASTKFP